MRVLACGGRDYRDFEVVKRELDYLYLIEGVDVLIEGGARGADTLARVWAVQRGVRVETYPAEWDVYGKAAGARRNAQMLAEGKPNLVVAFPGGRGTADMVRQAKAAGVPVVFVAF